MGQSQQEPGRFVESLTLGTRTDLELYIAPAPNFISHIFYLNIAMAHYGYLKTVESYLSLSRHVEDTQRMIDSLEQDRSWVGVRSISLRPKHWFQLLSFRPLSNLVWKWLSSLERFRRLLSTNKISRSDIPNS